MSIKWETDENGETVPAPAGLMANAVKKAKLDNRWEETLRILREPYDNFEGYAVIVNHKDRIQTGFQPNIRPDVEDEKSYCDNPETVKVVIYADPRIPTNHLADILKSFGDYLNREGQCIDGIPLEDRLRSVEERRKYNEKQKTEGTE